MVAVVGIEGQIVWSYGELFGNVLLVPSHRHIMSRRMCDVRSLVSWNVVLADDRTFHLRPS